MAKEEKKDNDETEDCPPPPGGCGGSGEVEELFNGGRRLVQCFTCYGSGKIPKKT